MKNAIPIVTLSILLSACAGLGPQSAAPLEQVGLAKADADDVHGQLVIRKLGPQGAARRADDPLPAVELSEDIVFKYLKAEIATQRQQPDTAFLNMLSLAQQTRDPRLAHRAAEIALNAKQADDAMTAVRLWRELAPRSDEATQYFLGLVVLGDSLDEAEPVLAQRLKDVRPQARGLMMFQIQRLLTRAKNKGAAFALLERVCEPYQPSAEAHMALAQSAYAKEDFERASAEAKAALALKPDSELAALTAVQIMRDKSAAAKFLARFLGDYPKADDVRVAYARLLVDQKEYRKASVEFETLLKSKPNDLTTLYALGILGAQNKDSARAEKYLTNYLKLLGERPDDDRDPAQALMVLAQLAEERNDTAAALKWLAQIESGDSYLGAQIKRAQLVAKEGDIDKARRLLKESNAEGEREQVQLISAEAQLLRDAKRGTDAMQVYEAGVQRFPNSTDLLYDYAMAAEKLDRLDLMEAKLRRIIELTPSNQHAYNALGYSFAERNIRLPEALELIEKALALAPEDPFIMDSMGWVQFRLGRLKEAEDALRRAYALRSDPEIAVHLGEVLWVRGQQDDARKLWRDARAKDPHNDTLKSTLTRLHVGL